MAHVSEPRPAGLGTTLSIVGILLVLGAMFVAAEHSQAMKVTFLMVAACALVVIGCVFLRDAFKEESLESGGLGTVMVATGAWFLSQAFQTDSDLALTSLMLIVLAAVLTKLGFVIRKGRITTH